TVSIYPFQPVGRYAADASSDAIDSNLVTTNLDPSAELALPDAMADDNTLVQRQPEQPSEIGRHGGYRHNCCLATHCNGALQNARRAKPLEYAEPTYGGQILPIGERACFAMRVSPKYRDRPALLSGVSGRQKSARRIPM